LIKWKRVEELNRGDVIVENISGANASDSIVKYGDLVNEELIRRLQMRGIQWVSVLQKPEASSEIIPLFTEEKIGYFETQINDVYEQIVVEKRIDIEKTREISKEISESVAKNYGAYIWPNLSKLKQMDDYTFTHQVNVAIIGSTLAFEHFGGDLELVNRFTAGGLLHDIGKLWIPPEILKSRERLPDMEFNIIKKHPTYGHGIAKQSGLEDTVILNSILYHHEQWDGNGYNEGKKGEEIPFESRLMMVADVYDALTTIRPYKRAWSPYEATTFLIQETKKKFDPFIVNLFLKVFGLYPVGTHVALSSGHTGVVVGNKTGAVSRPLVRLNDGQNTILDMFVDRGVFIKQVLSDTSQLVVN